MEKIIYLARFPAEFDNDKSRQQCVKDLSHALLQTNDVQRLTIQLEDGDVADAAIWRREGCATLPQLVISIFIKSVTSHETLTPLVAAHLEAVDAYLVHESEVLNPNFLVGQRGTGTAQICCFNASKGLNQAEFIKRWQAQHTEIALRTQSTFGYRQNLVVETLTQGATNWSAIVEEHFPSEAMTSPEVFFNAIGDTQKLQKHQREMADSCKRFIDFESINVIHMSEYVIK